MRRKSHSESGREKKEFEKMLDSQMVGSKIRTPNDEQLSC
ncbi:hypothetical protein THZG08_350001 [Vibrio owensii]|nr:hypothetical protein THZG08_350001 [Vibrio owensii]